MYDLFLSGIADNTPDTNRRVKAALVGDLHLSVEQVIELFSQPLPAKIVSYANEQQAKNAAKILELAGASIVVKAEITPSPIDSDASDEEDAEELEFEFNLPTDTGYQRKGTHIHHLHSDEETETDEESEELTEDDIERLVTEVSAQTVLQRAEDTRLITIALKTSSDKTDQPITTVTPSTDLPTPRTEDNKNELNNTTDEPAPITTQNLEIRGKTTKRTRVKIPKPSMSQLLQKIHQISNFRQQPGLGSTVVSVVGICTALITLTFVSTLLLGADTEDSFLQAAVKGFIAEPVGGSKIPLGVAAHKVNEANSGTITVKKSEGSFSAELSLKVKTGKLTDLTFYLTTPAPPPPTDQQIVVGDRGKPWLRALRFDKPKFDNRKDGEQITTAPAMAFISHAEERIREQATAVTTYRFDKKSGNATATLLINKGFEEIPSENFVFEKTSAGNYKLFVRQTFKGTFDAIKPSEATILTRGDR